MVNHNNGNLEQDGCCFCPQGSAGKAQILGRYFEEECDKPNSRKYEVTYPANKPLLSNAGLKLIPDARKRCNGELMGKKKKIHKNDCTFISGVEWANLGFSSPSFPTGRLYVNLNFYNFFR